MDKRKVGTGKLRMNGRPFDPLGFFKDAPKVLSFSLPMPAMIEHVCRLFEAIMRVNREAIFIGEELFLAGCGQFQGMRLESTDSLAIRFSMLRYERPINEPIGMLDMRTGGVLYGPRPFAWLDEDILRMLHARPASVNEQREAMEMNPLLGVDWGELALDVHWGEPLPANLKVRDRRDADAAHACRCSMPDLMTRGCSCGGK